jgi:hypothetical protein
MPAVFWQSASEIVEAEVHCDCVRYGRCEAKAVKCFAV